MINPSIEYIVGGPTKMELTGHVDVGGTSQPTLMNMWHGSHYGGIVLTLDQDENWSKVAGEFERPGVIRAAGTTLKLGDVHCTPERADPTLWQIGVADRSAAEFRNGDYYWCWGN